MWQLFLTGMVTLELNSFADGGWNGDRLFLSITEMDIDHLYATLPPPRPGFHYEFSALQWTVFATVNGHRSDNTVHPGEGVIQFGITMGTVFTPRPAEAVLGMYADLNAKGRTGTIFRVGYSVNLYGFVIQARNPVIP